MALGQLKLQTCLLEALEDELQVVEVLSLSPTQNGYVIQVHEATLTQEWLENFHHGSAEH